MRTEVVEKGKTIWCGIRNPASPSQVLEKPFPPDWQLTLHALPQTTLLCLQPADLQVSQAPTTSCKLFSWPSKHWTQEEMCWGQHTLSGGPLDMDNVICNLANSGLLWGAPRHQTTGILWGIRQSFSSAFTIDINWHTLSGGPVLRRKWWVKKDKQSLPLWSLQSML